MMRTNSKVSICIPTHNRAHLIGECIDSCLAQRHPDIEIVIGDDSAGDATERLVRERYGGDPRIRYARNRPSLGQAPNVTSLFARASGDKILLIHDDDFLLRDGLARLLAQWERHPDLDAAFGNQYVVDQRSRIDRAATRRLNLMFHRRPAAAGLQPQPGRVGLVQMFPNNGWLARADLVKRIGYDDSYGSCCDYVFNTRLCLAARRISYVDDYVSCYRETDVSISRATRHSMRSASLMAWHFVNELALPPELEPARRLALRRLVPIVVSLYARNHEPRTSLAIALGNLYAYRFGLSPRLYYHLLMMWKGRRGVEPGPV
ncbi:glycosyltransferase family 2 protein [Burkholderia perseverans]|uniref:glycosyltransferase family 2 protein n=1 Tax=Burkholderia perseverans TaxID=2615214 RepID=UPI001FEDD0D8|nr:glycosyltransferase family 2 protein [Burkholderia perseverans]